MSSFSHSSSHPHTNPTSLVHDGSRGQFCGGPRGKARYRFVTEFSILPGVKKVADNAFHSVPFLSLSGLVNSDVVEIGTCAFTGAQCETLEGLPPGLTSIKSYAFQCCDKLRSLRCLPLATAVESQAFARCSLLEAKAIELGCVVDDAYQCFGDIDAWVEDRKMFPTRRWAILSCVRYAIELEEAEDGVAPLQKRIGKLSGKLSNDTAAVKEDISPLLKEMAKLPREMVREIVEFCHGDHELKNFKLDMDSEVMQKRALLGALLDKRDEKTITTIKLKMRLLGTVDPDEVQLLDGAPHLDEHYRGAYFTDLFLKNVTMLFQEPPEDAA
ncbi:hypothetical protein TeGR_g13330 [Tetraparma gracilis]|uniref:Uncharacterized protein n=1 Tax=Tetraparma gracilis TaxID=2962635 RepID=A0ABQ6N456_9STRA|nr:hypothetical protein TeGR_g13330 [Tetraparma gracilis]